MPTSGEDVVININASILVDNSSTINSLTISISATVSFTSSGGGRTITIGNTGSSIGGGSTLTLQGSTGSGTRSMTLNFTGGGSKTMSIAGTLVLTAVGEGTIYDATNSLTTVTGTLRMMELGAEQVALSLRQHLIYHFPQGVRINMPSMVATYPLQHGMLLPLV